MSATRSGSSALSYRTKCWLSPGGSLSIAVSITEASIAAVSLVRDRIVRGHHTYGIMLPLQEPSMSPSFERCVFTANSVRSWTDDVWRAAGSASTSGRQKPWAVWLAYGPGYKKCVYKASEISRTIGMLTIVQREGGVLARQRCGCQIHNSSPVFWQSLRRVLDERTKEVCYW